MSLSNLAALKRRFYRLVNTASDDAGMTEWDPAGSDETLLQLLNEGLREAFEYLVDQGSQDWWLENVTIGNDVRGTGADRYMRLPGDFYRLAGDRENSALYTGNTQQWGRLMSREDRLRVSGNRYWLESRDGDPELDNLLQDHDFTELVGNSNWYDSATIINRNTDRAEFTDIGFEIMQDISGLVAGTPYIVELVMDTASVTGNDQTLVMYVEMTTPDGHSGTLAVFGVSEPIRATAPDGTGLLTRATALDYKIWEMISIALNGANDVLPATFQTTLTPPSNRVFFRMVSFESYPSEDTPNYSIDEVRIYPATQWAVRVATGASVPSDLKADYIRHPLQLVADDDLIDFPHGDRELIVAFAAVRAMEESWYVGDPQDEQRLVRFLQRCKANASRNARKTGHPKLVDTHPVLGERWYI